MENENSVCFIAKINKIESIKDADKIELATINGWTSVVQKEIHNVGDLILCVTTDAVIPQELADKWGVTNYLRKGSRVRTVRLKGVLSECILIPLFDIYDLLPKQGFSNNIDNDYTKEGADLMSTLDITKYEAPTRQIETPKIKKVYFKWKEIYKPKMWKSYFNYLYNVTKNKFKKYYKDNINFEIYYKFPNQKNVPNMFNGDEYISITRKIHGSNFRCGIVKKNYLSLNDKILFLLTRDPWIKYQFIVGSHIVQKHQEDLV